jgi:hypothetical protein
LFLRAQGLQLIYDNGNGRNSMIKDTDGKNDICRESLDCLNAIGLLPKLRW